MDAREAEVSSEVFGNNAKRPLFWYQRPLLRLWSVSVANLLLRQGALLRMWADTAPKPWFELQSSLLRLCADNCELVARSYEARIYEECVGAPGTALKQEQFGGVVQGVPTDLSRASEKHHARLGESQVPPSSDGTRQNNDPTVGQVSDLEVVRMSDTSELATDQAEAAVKDAAEPVTEAPGSVSEVGDARHPPPRMNKADVGKRAPSTKKSVRKTMKSRKKPNRK